MLFKIKQHKQTQKSPKNNQVVEAENFICAYLHLVSVNNNSLHNVCQ